MTATTLDRPRTYDVRPDAQHTITVPATRSSLYHVTEHEDGSITLIPEPADMDGEPNDESLEAIRETERMLAHKEDYEWFSDPHAMIKAILES